MSFRAWSARSADDVVVDGLFGVGSVLTARF